MAEGIITRRGGGGGSLKSFPNFTYDGDYFFQQVGLGKNTSNALWLATTGSITFDKNVYADIYMVGGGGGGGFGNGSGGGGGGYTATFKNVFIPAGTTYDIEIGEGGYPSTNKHRQGDPGNRTRAFGFYVNGGYGGGSVNNVYNVSANKAGGDGGSGGGGGIYNANTSGRKLGHGGVGGINGGNGSHGRYVTSGEEELFCESIPYGVGSGKSTHVFEDPDNLLVAYGGAGGILNVRFLDGDRSHIETKNLYGNGPTRHWSFGSGGMGGSNFRNYYGRGDSEIESLDGSRGQNGVVIIKTKRAFAIPDFTYENGKYILHDVHDDNWQLKFLTNGTFIPNESMNIDIFAVGGGGSGASCSGGGGAGGYTATRLNCPLESGTSYAINIGAGGVAPSTKTSAYYPKGKDNEASLNQIDFRHEITSYGNYGKITSAFGIEAAGGSGGTPHPFRYGGTGGSAGGSGTANGTNAYNGYSNGGSRPVSSNKGEAISWTYGLGQNSSTRAFGEDGRRMYAGGGGGGGGLRSGSGSLTSTQEGGSFGRDGAGGGGLGGLWFSCNGQSGEDYYGSGGGGGAYRGYGGAGGSGAVVIRNSIRETSSNLFNISEGRQWTWIDENTAKIFTNATFTPERNTFVDICLVGGGGGGGFNVGGGGGGGYVNTFKAIRLNAQTDNYCFTIGEGGKGATTASSKAIYNGHPTSFGIKTPNLENENEFVYSYLYTVNGGSQGLSGQASKTNAGKGGNGGSGGGGAAWVNLSNQKPSYPGFGGNNGGNGQDGVNVSDSDKGKGGTGQGAFTRAFGDGELFAGGGAGGMDVIDETDSTLTTHGVLGGMGGGGAGRGRRFGLNGYGGGGCGGNRETEKVDGDGRQVGSGFDGGSGVALIRVRNDIPDFEYFYAENYTDDANLVLYSSTSFSSNQIQDGEGKLVDKGVTLKGSSGGQLSRRFIKFNESNIMIQDQRIPVNGENINAAKVEFTETETTFTVGYLNEEKTTFIAEEEYTPIVIKSNIVSMYRATEE